MAADNVTSFDYTDRLGIKKMPPGYLLIGLDSGHFMWERVSGEAESAIHWSKWAIWRSAWHDYNAQQQEAAGHE